MKKMILSRKAYIAATLVALLSIAVPSTVAAQGTKTDDIAASTIMKQGDTAPDFTVSTLDGKKTSLSELKGKVVLVNFWATWCPPCREELKHVQKEIIDRFKGKDFVFMPISRGEKPSVVEAFLSKTGYTFTVYVDPKQEVFKLFATNYIPRNFLIGKDGKVKYVSVGYDAEEFAKLIEAVERELK